MLLGVGRCAAARLRKNFPDREWWLGAAVFVRFSSETGSPLTWRPSLSDLKTPMSGVRNRFAPRFVDLNGRRPRENERPGRSNIVTGLLYFNRRTRVF